MRITQGEDTSEDGKPLLWPTRPVVDTVNGGLAVTNPEQEAGAHVSAFEKMQEGGEFAAVGIDEEIRGVPTKCAEFRSVRGNRAEEVTETIRAGRVGDDHVNAMGVGAKRVSGQKRELLRRVAGLGPLE